ncbi:hypothetical protein PG993_011785 [Apiospora rasikravindrae]|uniref:Uncharacterized protein n=1 Tax=Apiospora rasikravindrae TaxID=990691 RepID=A0ABR1S2V7_9PEZI
MAEEAPTRIPTFTMTPDLERVLARGRDMHPTFPIDKRGILQYVGLNEAMINRALEKYRADFPSDPEEVAVQFNEMNGDLPIEGFRFPLLDRFDTILMERAVPEIDELDISYDDYAKGGLAEGLRPEFAVFCGLHPSEADYQNERYRDLFYIKRYQKHADNIIKGWLSSLSLLWNQKLKLEKAKRQTETQLKSEEL